ncbi:MAG: hypothetical protein DHS20C03_11990 [Minwuia thermotolerans]|nr:MAG: hypothetical protein DHS20C03_11990 [Minwuia thermotolerans]
MSRLAAILAVSVCAVFASLAALAEPSDLGEKLQRHVTDNWVVPDVFGDAELIHVVAVLQMNPDGTVDGAPELTVTDDGGQTDATVQSYVDSVRAAIVSSQPFPLPADSFDVWRTIEISFNLKEESGK